MAKTKSLEDQLAELKAKQAEIEKQLQAESQVQAEVDKIVDAVALSINTVGGSRERFISILAEALGITKSKASKGASKPRAQSLRSALIQGLKAKGLSGWKPATSTEELEKLFAKNYGEHALTDLKVQHPPKAPAKK